LSKAVTADVLKTIHSTIMSNRIPMSEEEAVMLWPRIEEFKRTTGREPMHESQDPLERRMSEALMWIREQKRKKLGEARAVG
jgi:hypothetical protein